MSNTSTDGVHVISEGRVARIILDRPRALNSLNLSMIRQIHDLLERWRSDPLRAITIESSTPGLFCAGGDIRQIWQNTLDDNLGASEEFFATEYRVNEMLASYPVPIVALIDGVCMGGGLGLSVHGPFRVVTERAVLAMPETAIGFFPDIGASYFLSRLPGGVGAWLGLSGTRIGPVEALEIGLATHHITAQDLPSLVRSLSEDNRPIDAVIRDLASVPTQQSWITAQRHHIDDAFTASSIESITGRLKNNRSEWALQMQETLTAMSPQSLELTLDLILWGKQRSLRECLDAERQAARQAVHSPDFIEGVRAALVDKDRTPIWGKSEYEGTTAQGEGRWNREHVEPESTATG